MSLETRISALIQQGESATLEFRQSFDKAAIETVCAFANAKGGLILIGVRDDATVLGVSVSDETIQNYINQIKTQTEPSLVVDIEELQSEIANLHLQSLQLSWNAYPANNVAWHDLERKKNRTILAASEPERALSIARIA